MPQGYASWKDYAAASKKRRGDMQTAEDMRDIDQYRGTVEKAAYGAINPALQGGYASINNYLAGAGPLADSGAGAALKARLASSIYGEAAGRVQSGVSDLVGNIINKRRDFQNQLALLKYQKKLQSTGPGGALGGFIGGIAGSAAGPIGASIGAKLGGGLMGGGSGGYYSSLSDYYGNLYGAPR